MSWATNDYGLGSALRAEDLGFLCLTCICMVELVSWGAWPLCSAVGRRSLSGQGAEKVVLSSPKADPSPARSKTLDIILVRDNTPKIYNE